MFGINPGLDAFWAGAIFGVILAVYFFVTHVQSDGGPERWQRWRASWIMSRDRRAALSEKSNDDPAFSPATTTPATSNNALQSGAISSNELLLGQARALAAMVKAGKIGETEGIKIVFGLSPSSTNARYQAARAALKAELERMTNHYPNMTPEQKQAREALGLNKV